MNLSKGLEGETPLDDISGLIPKWVRTVADLDKAELENMVAPTVKYLSARPSEKLAPFTAEWMLKLHREMLSDVWKWAGEIRNAELNIGVEWTQVSVELENLSRDAAFWRECKDEERDLIEEAAILHHRAVWIHPFFNGNGRWARLLAEVWLRQHSQSGIEWPERELSTKGSSIRLEYIAALKTADAGDSGPIIELHRRLIRM